MLFSLLKKKKKKKMKATLEQGEIKQKMNMINLP